MPESRKEEKDGCNRHAAGRETLPRQNQYKQRTHAETSMGAGLIPHQITGEHFTELFVARR